MKEAERYLLLALSLLVRRQQRLGAGKPEWPWFAALREPLIFDFVYEREAFRCTLDMPERDSLLSAVLVADRVGFVCPLQGLTPHLIRVQTGTLPEIKLSATLAERLGLQKDDLVYAVYSPLHVLFTAESGFFLPRREPWHAFVARCVSARIPGARCHHAARHSRVQWSGGAFQAAERGGGAALSYQGEGLQFELEVSRHGFDLHAAGEREGALMRTLRRLSSASHLPDGVRVVADRGEGVSVFGGIA